MTVYRAITFNEDKFENQFVEVDSLAEALQLQAWALEEIRAIQSNIVGGTEDEQGEAMYYWLDECARQILETEVKIKEYV